MHSNKNVILFSVSSLLRFIWMCLTEQKEEGELVIKKSAFINMVPGRWKCRNSYLIEYSLSSKGEKSWEKNLQFKWASPAEFSNKVKYSRESPKGVDVPVSMKTHSLSHHSTLAIRGDEEEEGEMRIWILNYATALKLREESSRNL
jgi:hypothetical protein